VRHPTQVERVKREGDDKGAQVKAARAALERHTQEMAAHRTATASREAALERLAAERLACLQQCRREERELPLSSGTLADVTETDAPVTLNYRSLGSEYKKARAPRGHGRAWSRSYCKHWGTDQDGTPAMETATQEKIHALLAQIDRMAPNMRAVDKYVRGEQRVGQFEAVRSPGRSAGKRAGQAGRCQDARQGDRGRTPAGAARGAAGAAALHCRQVQAVRRRPPLPAPD
jgi:structural maintenance of chromosome 1